jgi:hypothetical protein
MSSRLNQEAVCLKCGGPIISMNPALKMCSVCEKAICAVASLKVKNRKNPDVRRWKLKVGMLNGMKAPKNR